MTGARLPALLLLAFLCPAPGHSSRTSVLDDPRFVRELNAGLDRLYGLELDEANRRFRDLASRRPGHPIGPVLQATVLWWRIQLDPMEEAGDDALLARIDEAVRLAERRLQADREDVDGLFGQAAAFALRGRLRSLRKDWIAAAWDGRRALKAIRTLHELRPRDPDLNLGLGLYDYLAAVAPERHPILRPLGPFFPKGDRQRGLAALHRAREQGQISHTEAAFFLLQLEYYFEVRYGESLKQVRWLRRRHPDNSIFHLYEGRVYSRWRQCARADRVFEDVLARRTAGRRGYGDHEAEVAYFHLARCAMLDRRLDDALRFTDRLEELARRRGSDLHSAAHLRRGMIHDLQGRRPQALAEYRRALDLPDMGTTHERAREYLKEPYRLGKEGPSDSVH